METPKPRTYPSTAEQTAVSFPRTADGSVATFTNTTASFKLTAGSNTLAITKSWGWVDIDYITVAKHTAASADALSATPSDPNANEAAKKAVLIPA